MIGNWEWRVGVLNGFGESAWQQLGQRVRKITVVMMQMNGRPGIVTPVTTGFAEGDPQTIEWDAAGLVAGSQKAKEDFVKDLERHWGGLKLVRPIQLPRG